MKKSDLAAHSPITQQSNKENPWSDWFFAALVLVGAALLAVAAYRAIGASLVGPFEHIWLDIWLQLLLMIFAAGVLGLGAVQLASNRRIAVLAAWLGVFLFLVTALPLRSTPFAIDGFGGDQRLYTAYVTKFAATAGNIDVIYPNLPAFYPPLYFYILGRVSAWLQIEPYAMLKLGMLATTALLPAVMALFWRPLLPGWLAAATTFVLLIEQNFHKPAEWYTMILFVPWWLYFVLNIGGRTFASWRRRLLWLGAGGLIGAFLFQSYYYWFFIGLISLPVGLVSPYWLGRADNNRRGILADAFGMLTSTALLSIFYWGPYLASMLATGGRDVLQSRWLAEGKLALPLPFTDESLTGVFLAFGLAYLVLTAGSSRVSRGLLALLAGLYLWFWLGYAGMLADHPLLTFRSYPMVNYLLALGGCIGLAQLWQKPLWFNLVADPQRSFARLWAGAIIVLCLFFGQQTIAGHVNNENVQLAIESTPPTAKLDAIDALMPVGSPPQTLLISRAHIDIFAFRPYFGFAAWSAHFSHPAGLFRQRTDFLSELAATHSPLLFHQALVQNRYDPIDGLLLEPDADGWLYRFVDDNFPDRTVDRTLHFPRRLLAQPCFRSAAQGELTLIQANDTCDAASVSAEAAQKPAKSAAVETLATRYNLGMTFGEHLRNSPPSDEMAGLEAQLMAADLGLVTEETLLDLLWASDGTLAERAAAALAQRLDHPLNIVLREPQGGGELLVLGYNLEEGTDETQPPRLALYFEVLQPLSQDYAIWLHSKRGDEQVNFDHQSPAFTSSWQAMSVYVDRTELAGMPEGAEVAFGFWNGATDARLSQPNGDTWLDLGRITAPTAPAQQ